MQLIATLVIGFSVISGFLILTTFFSCRHYHGAILPRIAGIGLLFALAALQCAHLFFLWDLFDIVNSRIYVALLFVVAPAFYFFSSSLLKIDSSYSYLDLLHFLPVLISVLIPQESLYPWAMLLSFIPGSAYVGWLAVNLYRLHSQRKRFNLEFSSLVVLFVVAIMVLTLGFSIPLITDKQFFAVYALLIGGAFFITLWIILRTPTISDEVQEAAQAVYAESSLKHVDIEMALERLDEIVVKGKFFTDENLSLSLLAEQLELTPHQLSELINTRLDMSFSRFIREQRISEAKLLLIKEPKASVLSIGLSVGFSTQSSFYAAFKELTGIAPGQFRKTNA